MISWLISWLVSAAYSALSWARGVGSSSLTNEPHAAPMTALYDAAAAGSLQGVHGLLARGSMNIDQGNSEGITPLIVAAARGHTPVVGALLSKGASVEAVSDQGATALHTSSLLGHLAVCELLIKAGSDLEATTSYGYTCLHLSGTKGHLRVMTELIDAGEKIDSRLPSGATPLLLCAQEGQFAACDLLVKRGAHVEARSDDRRTPLHVSACEGHVRIMEMLIAAGANINSRLADGRTPLHMCAMEGHVGAVRVLLRARANPLLTNRTTPVNTYVPLDAAVRHGRLGVVRELIQQLGIRGCAGASGGMEALRLAAQNDYVDIVVALVEAGVEDAGAALVGAIGYGREAPVKALLRLKERATGPYGARAYANVYANLGGQPGTPLILAIGFARHRPLPRIVRMLVDAGADTVSAVKTGTYVADATPLEFATRYIREKKVDGQGATEEQLHKLEAIRRLLLRVESVRAVSWLWPRDVLSLHHAVEGSRKTQTISTPMRRMLPLLRRRARTGSVSPSVMFRSSGKP